MKKSFKATVMEVMLTADSYKTSARLGAMAAPFVASAPAMAQGFIQGFQNLNQLTQAGIGLLIAVGMLGGLGFILGALFSMYKKYDRGNDEITWGKIGVQLGAGGLAMALAWVGVQVVETLGGGQGDIGRNF